MRNEHAQSFENNKKDYCAGCLLTEQVYVYMPREWYLWNLLT